MMIIFFPAMLMCLSLDTYIYFQQQSFFSEEANKVVRDKYQELMTVLHQHTDEERNMDTHSLQLLVLEANEAFDSGETYLESQLVLVFTSEICSNVSP